MTYLSLQIVEVRLKPGACGVDDGVDGKREEGG